MRVQAEDRISKWRWIRLLPLGVAAALTYWMADSLLHSALLHERSFPEALLFVTPRELWTRLLTAVILLVFILVFQSLLNRRRKVEHALRDSEEKFRTIFESAGELITYLGSDGRIIDINPRIEEVLGFRREEIIGRRLSELEVYPDGVLPRVMESFTSVTSGGSASGETIELRHRNGEAVFLDTTTVAIKKHDRIDGVLLISRDVTNLERERSALKESEERYRHLLESIPEGVYVLDPEWRFLLVNQTAKRFVQRPDGDLLGRKLTDLDERVVETTFFKTFTQVMKTRQAAVVTDEYRYADGTSAWFEARVYPVPEGVLCISTDVTERTRAERKILEGQERWRCLTENTDDTIIIADRNGDIQYINKTFPPYSPQDIIGRKMSDFIPDAHQGILRERLKKVYETGEPVEYEISVLGEKIGLGKGTRWFRTTAVPMVSEGVVSRVIMIAADITERKRADEALRESEHRLLGIINSSPDPILVCNPAGTVVQHNEALLTAHGLSSEDEIVGQSILKLFAPESKKRIAEAIRELPELGVLRDLQVTLLSKDGGPFPAEISAGVVRDAEGRTKYLVGVAKDITERRKVERELWDATEKWTSLMENTSDIITVMDRDGRVQYTNRALPPYSVEDTIGRTMFEYIGKDQHELMADTLRKVFETGQTESYEMRSEIAGVGSRWFSAKMVPVKHEGNVVSVVTIATDITERKRVEEEREKLRQQLAYAEKMESLGHLARGVAHEINNPLTSVLATAELVLDEMSDGRVSKSDIEQIVREARRIQETVRSFLGFAKARDFTFEDSDINAIMTTAIAAIGKGQLRDCEVVANYDKTLPRIKVSKFHIQEVFVNLIVNALHSMQDGGRLTITTVEERDDVVVSIKDTGVGIRAEDLSRIFEPYFTTREKRGTGLGLSISRDIVMRHGGRIEVDSDGPGRGAEFRVFLPK